jgi:Holin of 3TMs, for gene-transfer release
MGILDALATGPMGALVSVGSKILDRVIPDPAANEAAKLELAKLAQEGELAKMANDTKLFETEQNNVTDRWKADMSSDSRLSKNIRPLALVAIFVAYFLFTMMSAFGYNAQESYVQLLGQWGQIIFLAYFGGRTVEKLADLKSKK